MARLFVTGTGTDVGKTLVAATLVAGVRQRHGQPQYYKPIQTGGTDSDRNEVRRRVPGDWKHFDSFLSLDLPLAPDQGADGTDCVLPTADDLAEALPPDPGPGQVLIVEGAGGVRVPINDRGETWIDYLKKADLPVLIVGRNELGTINHTSLTLTALENAAISVLGVVLTTTQETKNIASLQRLHPATVFYSLNLVARRGEFTVEVDEASNLADFVFEQLKTYDARLQSDELINFDRDCVWHPYTQHQTASAPELAVRASGSWLELLGGRKVVDGSGSWWVNTVGHGRSEIGEAMAAQQQTLDHVIFARMTHKPAVTLATRILKFADSNLSRVFFSDNGSTAVEVALKMAFQSFANRGQTQRTKFLAFDGSYHGDTFGAMAAGHADGFHGVFRPLLFDCLWVPPVTRHPSRVCPDGIAAMDRNLQVFRQTLEANSDRLAGVIIEPLVQGAGGMMMQPVNFLRQVAAICRGHGIPLILDEVFTGMGRVGDTFAFKRAGIEPDIICLAKGLTGGTMPLALTLATEEIFQAFLSNTAGNALMHGHSYTGNPISCAAAIATLNIVQREGLVQRALDLEGLFAQWGMALEGRHGILYPRSLGGIFAFEFPNSGFGDYFDLRAGKFVESCLSNGLFIRTLGNTVYIVPPLTIDRRALDTTFGAIERALARDA